MYAIIKVNSFSDYIEDVECLATFPTEVLANEYLADLKKKLDESRKNRIDYIHNFVDNMQIPETDYKGWQEFVSKFGICPHILPKDFKMNLKGHLGQPWAKLELEDYNPPKAMIGFDNLFVVKVK